MSAGQTNSTFTASITFDCTGQAYRLTIDGYWMLVRISLEVVKIASKFGLSPQGAELNSKCINVHFIENPSKKNKRAQPQDFVSILNNSHRWFIDPGRQNHNIPIMTSDCVDLFINAAEKPLIITFDNNKIQIPPRSTLPQYSQNQNNYTRLNEEEIIGIDESAGHLIIKSGNHIRINDGNEYKLGQQISGYAKKISKLSIFSMELININDVTSESAKEKAEDLNQLELKLE